jgi:hypothetical protein
MHASISIDLGKLYYRVLNCLLLKEDYHLVFRQSVIVYFLRNVLNYHSTHSSHVLVIFFFVLTCPSLRTL